MSSALTDPGPQQALVRKMAIFRRAEAKKRGANEPYADIELLSGGDEFFGEQAFEVSRIAALTTRW